MSSSAEWLSIKGEARTLEQYIEHRLHEVPPAPPSDVEAGDPGLVRLKEIEDSLKLLQIAVERLGGTAVASELPANAAVAQRYRDVLAYLWSEHRKQDSAHRARAATAALLGPRRSGGAADEGASAADILLRERGSLQRSTSAVDDILSQASATSEMLAEQRAVINAAVGRIGGFITRVPGATAVIGAIGARRFRNDNIVGLVMAACVCFTVWWLLLRKT